MSKINYRIVFLGMALFILGFINNVQAYKLHLILACDQDAKGIGESVMADHQSLKSFFSSQIDRSMLDVVPLETHNLTAESIYEAIDSMDVRNSDTILFYYSGHGAYDYGHGTQLLTLRSGNISRIDLLKKLREKHANLLILLTDCCNVIPEELIDVPEPEMIRGHVPGLIKLFMETSGELDITSSRISESSLCDKKGGYFTKLFIVFLKKNAYNKNVEWKDLPEEVQPELTRLFKEALESEGVEYIDLAALGLASLPGLPAKQYDQRMYVYACPGMPIRFGAGVRLVDNQLKVVKILSNTPAEKAGVEVGDYLLEINGSPLKTYGDYDILINYSSRQMRLKVKKSNGSVEDLNVTLAYD